MSVDKIPAPDRHQADVHLHIGLEKSGSTSIQHYFRQHRESLAQQKVLYPRSLGYDGHTKLAITIPDFDKIDFLRRQASIVSKQKIRQETESIAVQLGQEIASHKPDAIIISCEQLSARLTTTEEVQRLRDFLSPFARSFRVYLYLRPQEKLIVSRYSTYIRSGGTLSLQEYLKLPRPAFLNYNALITLWATVFQPENLNIRIFSSDTLVDGNAVTDFLHQLKLSKIKFPPADQERSNTSLSASTLERLRRIYLKLPLLQKPRMWPARKLLTALLKQGGKTETIDHSLATAIELQFESENRAVAQRYFQRESLFNNDTSSNQHQTASE